MSRGRYEWEDPTDDFPGAYRVDGHPGVAWHVWGWEVEPDEDTEWTGIKNRTGRVVATMVGDDAHWLFEPDEVHEIEEEDYCSGCGQIGCGWG